MLQAQEARLREQETQRQERARLEEILTMCAEYERQAQIERQQQQQQGGKNSGKKGTTLKQAGSPSPHGYEHQDSHQQPTSPTTTQPLAPMHQVR